MPTKSRDCAPGFDLPLYLLWLSSRRRTRSPLTGWLASDSFVGSRGCFRRCINQGVTGTHWTALRGGKSLSFVRWPSASRVGRCRLSSVISLDTRPMSTPAAILAFYDRLWNAGDPAALDILLSSDFSFRGSLGDELVGRAAFWEYVCRLRTALADYRCNIVECVAEDGSVFARMHFSGRHVAPFLGHPPTGRTVSWSGAALFHLADGLITDAWVLGDIDGLQRVLEANAGG